MGGCARAASTQHATVQYLPDAAFATANTGALPTKLQRRPGAGAGPIPDPTWDWLTNPIQKPHPVLHGLIEALMSDLCSLERRNISAAGCR